MRRGFLQQVVATLAALPVLLALALVLAGRPAAAQVVATSQDGNMTYRIGAFAQVQGQAEDNAAANSGTADNLGFLRRFRLQGEFTFYKNFEMFFETDDPNYGKGNPDGTKNVPTMMLQTLYMTYKFAPEFMIDAGELLGVNSYNHLQSAASILPVDLGAFTNLESTPLTANNGRDWGVEARGYIADHLEYRAGALEGLRGVGDRNPLRLQGRLSYYFWGIETTRFYRGTSLGKIATWEIGTSYDAQSGKSAAVSPKGYKMYDFDTFFDQPVNGGDGITLQADYQHYDGGTLVTALPKQHVLLVEGGYYINALKTQPFAQYTEEKYDSGITLPNQKQWQVGLGFYFHGYNSNFKIGYGHVDQDNVRNRKNIVAQYQYAFF